MRTTGPLSVKSYRCTHCDAISQESTNHWGEIYSPCVACSWKRPGQATVKACLEPVPEGYAVPPPWTVAKLADVVKVVKGRAR